MHNLGEPIPRTRLPVLFEPMTRGDPSGSAARSVGLGLYIVRQIARAHGGDVEAQSTHADGTTFTFCFPARPST